MHRVTLLTGSNDEQAEAILHQAATMLCQSIGVSIASSDIFRSEAWGFTAERAFYNQALTLATTLTPLEVLEAVQTVERTLGRRRDVEQEERERTGQRYASRVVDVDVMFYDKLVIRHERLTVPHPLLHQREFALRPLCQIMGSFVHPELGLSLDTLLERLKEN